MKGTASKGKKSGKQNHLYCRRCGHRAYHKKKKVCSHCGYGRSARLRVGANKKKFREK